MGKANTEESFWCRVQILRPTDCWEWQGTRGRRGYGQMSWEGRNHYTHRLAFCFTSGRLIPAGSVVRHSCDNPPCCNPAHLLLGTQKENNRDMWQRGRASVISGEERAKFQVRGSRVGTAKLNEVEVREIRRRADAGETQRDLASEFGISEASMSRLIHRLRWAHV